jgi:23S rRNA (cytosine1962-C5)-methyltransferase
MSTYPRVILKKGKEEPVKRFHPWIFSGAILSVEDNLHDGDIVEVFSNKGIYLATGHFQNSSIAVKLFTWDRQEIDHNFWIRKIQLAYKLRESLGLAVNLHTNCYRLVHNEGDSLPGLIVDFYAGTAVLQSHSLGMYRARTGIAEAIKSVLGSKLQAIYDKSSESLRKSTGIISVNEFLFGQKGETEILENDCRFYVDFESGQKTGFFLDQRNNRENLGKFASGKKVLNMFSYTGGFSIYALKAGAALVHSVDSSVPACDMTKKNVILNGFGQKDHEVFATDARNYLESVRNSFYNLIVLDPPAYAKNTGTRSHAINGYKALNAAAIKKIAPEGILFTFSCSQVVDRQQFASAVAAAAIESGRRVQVIGQLGQPGDHPLNIFQPESEYLKGLILSVG